MHLHWRFSAWNGGEKDREVMHMVQVSVIGYNDESSALEAARRIIVRDVFKLNSVYECNTCGFNQQNADSIRKLAEAR